MSDESNTALVPTTTTTANTAADQPQDVTAVLLQNSQFGARRFADLKDAFEQDVINHMELDIFHRRFELDAVMELRICALASSGLSVSSIGRGCGVSAEEFTKLRQQHPKIDALIDQGRYIGALKITKLSWDAVNNPRDNARNQELARMHRMLETEEAAIGAEGARIEKTAEGFTLTVVSKKEPANTAG